MTTHAHRPTPRTLDIGGTAYRYYSLDDLMPADQLARLPYAMRILLENVARRSPEHLDPLRAVLDGTAESGEIGYYPNRLMFHDTTCLPALVDFAGMRDAVGKMDGDARLINPEIPAVLAIDHSVIVEHFDQSDAFDRNLDIDFRRNAERYRFLKWAERSLDNFSVVPPGTGIIHQVNMESLATVVWSTPADDGGADWIHPDNMVATDSHTPMINALGVLAWGVGGLEGQAAMLGEPVTLPIPEVVGIRLTGALGDTVTAMDLALCIAELLRAEGVVGKFVEFCGPGLAELSLAARGTVANMAPEYGATIMFFPFDDVAMDYLALSGRDAALRERVRVYLDAQSLWRHEDSPEPVFAHCLSIDLSTIEPSVAGPHQPHQRHRLSALPASYRDLARPEHPAPTAPAELPFGESIPQPAWADQLDHGAVVIAAITSCTNTANPAEVIQAGLLARRARERGLMRKPWVKTSLSPGSRVVVDYLKASGLQADFDALGFYLVGIGCMTCIGNSGRLIPAVEARVAAGLDGVAVLSGNRNFSGRVNPSLSSGYLMSPALVVAYALAGDVRRDLNREPLTFDDSGQPVYLRELMPRDEDVDAVIRDVITPQGFAERNASLWQGTSQWQSLNAEGSLHFDWQAKSTYLRRPRYLEAVPEQPHETLAVHGARVIMQLGDNVTTDHISPAGAIPADSVAGRYLIAMGENPQDLNQYSTRRSNHEVMLRGAYTNLRVANQLPGLPEGTGVYAHPLNGDEPLPLFEASQSYLEAGIPLVAFAGQHYGAGSSRDWAAKAQALLGIHAVIAQGIERIHRSNLIGMGVLPLLLPPERTPDSLALTGGEVVDIDLQDTPFVGRNIATLTLRRGQHVDTLDLVLRIDSTQELNYLMNGGILPYVVRKTLTRVGADAGQTSA